MPQHVSGCTREQLGPFLRQKCPALLEKDIEKLFDENITGETFVYLTDEVLKEMGVTTGSRMTILKLIAKGPVFLLPLRLPSSTTNLFPLFQNEAG